MTPEIRQSYVSKMLTEDRDSLVYVLYAAFCGAVSYGFFEGRRLADLRKMARNLNDCGLENLAEFPGYGKKVETKSPSEINSPSDLVPGKIYLLVTRGEKAKCVRRGKFSVLFHKEGSGNKIWMNNTFVHETVKPLL